MTSIFKNKLSVILLLTTLCFFTNSCKKDCVNDCSAKEPSKDCMCTQQYDPVCGCNNVTYGNACEAKCAGITKYSKGECNTKK